MSSVIMTVISSYENSHFQDLIFANNKYQAKPEPISEIEALHVWSLYCDFVKDELKNLLSDAVDDYCSEPYGQLNAVY